MGVKAKREPLRYFRSGGSAAREEPTDVLVSPAGDDLPAVAQQHGQTSVADVELGDVPADSRNREDGRDNAERFASRSRQACRDAYDDGLVRVVEIGVGPAESSAGARRGPVPSLIEGIVGGRHDSPVAERAAPVGPGEDHVLGILHEPRRSRQAARDLVSVEGGRRGAQSGIAGEDGQQFLGEIELARERVDYAIHHQLRTFVVSGLDGGRHRIVREHSEHQCIHDPERYDHAGRNELYASRMHDLPISPGGTASGTSCPGSRRCS